LDGYAELVEMAAPAAPAANRIRMYAVDDQGKHFIEIVDEDGVVIRVQRDVAVYMARNETGVQIDKGKPVYINGVHAASGVPTIALAKSDSASTMPCAGITNANIANNGFGKVLGFGRISNVDTSAFNVNDSLWVSSSVAGGFQTTEPAAPNIAQRVGIVMKSNAGSGSFLKLEGMFERKYVGHSLATAANDFIVASGAGAFVKKTLAETLTILGKAAASGLASLDSSSLVVQNPANATATATASKIPIADGSGKLDTWVSASSTTVSGLTEAAIASEVNTGTDAARAVTPDALAGSNFGIRYVEVICFDFTTDNATGDGKGYFHIPTGYGGMNLVEVHAQVITAGTTGTEDIQIANVTQAADMLTTKITIDSTETGSHTAATPAVIDTNNDDVATNDLIRIDVDAVQTTKAKGLIVTLGFQLP
jgi:hypothetical protein